MKPISIDEFYAEYASLIGIEGAALLPPDIAREIGHFNVFDVAELFGQQQAQKKPTMPYDRRAYYKVSLLKGRSRAEYADKVIGIERNGLLFATPKVPYHWGPVGEAPGGHFCIFTEAFMLPAKSGVVLDELPLFRAGGCPIFEVTDAEYAEILGIFRKMGRVIGSDYGSKYDLLRTYLLELLHFGQRLQPASPAPAPPSAGTRVTALFAELLERQFPLEAPHQTLRLRTAKDYADRLAVHVNHLNKVLKEHTGRTTTELISGRIALEAKLLLRQTNWNVSEIADSLGFAAVPHFSNFFKRQTSLSPLAFRQQA